MDFALPSPCSALSKRTSCNVFSAARQTKNRLSRPVGSLRFLISPSRLSFRLTTILTGFLSPIPMISSTASVMVAENKCVLRCFGRWRMMRSTSRLWSGEESKRSASSKTSTSRSPTRTSDWPRGERRNEASRPGVPTRMEGWSEAKVS